MLKEHIDNILGKTNYDASCRGTQAMGDADALVKHHFEKEGLSYTGWHITEIPVADASGKYPIAVVCCLINSNKRKSISVNFDRNGNIFDVNPDELCTISLPNIKEAIEHTASKY